MFTQITSLTNQWTRTIFLKKTEINDWLTYLLLLTTDQLILRHHNMNRFKPFAVKSNDSNSIISLKSQFLVIFSHIGDLLTIVGPISTWANGGRWDSTIIGTVLDHFQPNQMTQIGLGVQKVCFCNFFRFLLSVRVKKEPKKISKIFIAFSCLEWLKKKIFLFFFQKFLNPLRSGPF